VPLGDNVQTTELILLKFSMADLYQISPSNSDFGLVKLILRATLLKGKNELTCFEPLTDFGET
jgi:hypothetical protein